MSCTYKGKKDNYQRRILEKVFWTSWAQLRLSNVHCKRILKYFKGKSWPLRSPSNSQIWCTLSFGEYEKVCNTHRPSNIQIVFKIIPSFLLQKQYIQIRKMTENKSRSNTYHMINARASTYPFQYDSLS